jgi:glycerophosphoryl diester phosphodiesterase
MPAYFGQTLGRQNSTGSSMSFVQPETSPSKLTRQFTKVCIVACALTAATLQAKQPAPFHIQAHRGAGDAFPENTLESFEWSWQHGVTPESDLRTTKDGVIVCFHDPNFKRVPYNISDALKKKSIETLPLAEVQKLDVGSFRAPQFAGQHIPTLDNVFEQMQGHPERLFYIDIKLVKLDQLEALVRKYKVERQIIFTSEQHGLIRDWKKLVPESLTLLWNRGTEKQLTKKLDNVRASHFDGITHLQIHVQVGDLNSDDPFMPSSAFLKKIGQELQFQDIVFQTFSAECKDQKVYEKLLALGVQSFATDYPEVTLSAVKSFREKSQH